MSVSVAGFKSSSLFESLAKIFSGLSEADRTTQSKKVNAVFQYDVKNSDGKVQTWFVDLKSGQAVVTKDKYEKKPDVTIIVGDADLLDLATGKLNGQKAFTSGKLKVKGNIMLATKVEAVFKQATAKSKL